MRRPPLLAALALALLPTLAAAQELRVSAIPDEAPTELQRKFAPLGAYLEKALGVKVTFVPVTDYAATVEGLAAGKLDLVWYGGFTFVQARRRTGNAIPLVQREEDARFHSKFIVPTASKAQSLKDLKGMSFAFGAVSSTSGHLMPRYFLEKELGPGQIIGLAHVRAGETSGVVVPLEPFKLTDRVSLGLFADEGDPGLFEYDPNDQIHSADQPFLVLGQAVTASVKVR